MKRFHVTYFYLASGMEGRADEEDYGEIEAVSPEWAIWKVIEDRYPDADEATRRFLTGCMTAREVN